MRGERGLRPVIENTLRCARHKLPSAVVDQADDLRARFVIETAHGKNLRDLLAELAISFEGGFDVLAHGGAKTFLEGHDMSCPSSCLPLVLPQIWQSLLDGV